jgi:hypothetical protein
VRNVCNKIYWQNVTEIVRQILRISNYYHHRPKLYNCVYIIRSNRRHVLQFKLGYISCEVYLHNYRLLHWPRFWICLVKDSDWIDGAILPKYGIGPNA